MTPAKVHALIPAAGSGERFGDRLPKQYQLIAGKTVLAHSIEALLQHADVDDVTVILSRGDLQFEQVEKGLSRPVSTATGGDSRAQSVMNGLKHLSEHYPDDDWVLVHDAARPCLPLACLDLLLNEGIKTTNGAILAIPVSDTLKRSNASHEIAETVAREQLWAAQTPQLFRLGELRKAMQAALDQGYNLTDEASALEFAGHRPKLLMGSSVNIKITWPGDLEIAAGLLAGKASGASTGVHRI